MRDVRIVPYQKKFAYSYSLGVFPTLELLKNRRNEVVKVVLSSRGKQNEGVRKIVSLCDGARIKIEWNDGVISKVGGNESMYAMGVFLKYQERLAVGKNHLVLVSPEDCGNLGTIIRTAQAFEIENIALIRPAVDSFDPKTIRSSMGARFGVSLEYFDDFEAYRQVHKNNCYSLMTDGAKKLSEVRFEEPFSLVFGSESAGLSEEYARSGQTVIIPQSSRVDSLNLSIAVGIVLYSASQKL